VTSADLARHVAMVRRLGGSIVALEDLVDGLVAGSDVDGMVAITFDDALAGVHDHALAVLADLDVAATVFAVSGRLGSNPQWWPGAGPLMSADQLTAWCDRGRSVGIHTRDHVSLPDLTRHHLEDQILGCVADLTEIGLRPTPIIAYPFGHHDPTVRTAAAEAGMIAGFTFLNGRITGAEDRFRLPRITMGRHSTGGRFAYHLLRSAGSWPDHQADIVLDGGPS
jgi:peptidoglycan/xylan/chitin deacetylase (PgdA/CDA1 family)